jgi:hypothetical protein
MLCSSLNPLGLTTSSDTLGGEELSQVPMLKQSLARLEVTFSWIAEQDGYTKSREIKTTRLGVNQHQAGY